ncbi:hypothetical protein P3T76_007722 [Phytophthora citrophthora]|uniref:Transposase putative helix-turn-helix domain-containing protein n=1 Tax=Phytophthora citrophthora TaxID=4793 RepID=A0AAD9LM52_9STRA|nr:hypothetical protein P3T76_007722 [Phytophthora citrophthora]
MPPAAGPAPIPRHITDELAEIGDVGDDDTKVNSMPKLRLYPTKEQKLKLDQLFAANRAVYNKMVAMSKEDRTTRLATRDKKVEITLRQLRETYRPIARLGTMDKYFRNKKGLARHRAVPDEVRDCANRDFMKGVKSSLAGFSSKLKKYEKPSFASRASSPFQYH